MIIVLALAVSCTNCRHTTVDCVVHRYLFGYLPHSNSVMEGACPLLQNSQTKSGVQLAFHPLIMGEKGG
jgi:hypothetical protein